MQRVYQKTIDELIANLRYESLDYKLKEGEVALQFSDNLMDGLNLDAVDLH